jgi:hydrogenase nickel incorporation protein HypA/HybF
VHELSVVHSIVTAAEEALAGHPVQRVIQVRLRVGELSGVVEEALQFSFEIATQGTILDGAQLVVDHLPAMIHCRTCEKDVELAGVQSFRCPLCGELSADLRQGRELAIESLEIEEGTPE